MLNQIEQCVHGGNVTVWTIIGRTVSDDLPGSENPGKILVLHTNGGVGLVVLQQYVVAGFVFLDQVVFQQ